MQKIILDSITYINLTIKSDNNDCCKTASNLVCIGAVESLILAILTGVHDSLGTKILRQVIECLKCLVKVRLRTCTKVDAVLHDVTNVVCKLSFNLSKNFNQALAHIALVGR